MRTEDIRMAPITSSNLNRMQMMPTKPVVGFQPFTQHGTAKRYPASVMRPGNFSGSVKPTCTLAQAREHSSSGTRRGTKAHKAWVADQVVKLKATGVAA